MSIKIAAELIVEICDDSECRLWTEGVASAFSRSGYKQGIKPSFKKWSKDLKRALKIHKDLRVMLKYKGWWHQELGTYGKREQMLTRYIIATRKGFVKDWALNG